MLYIHCMEMLLNILQIQLDQDSPLDHDLRYYLVLGRNQNYLHNYYIIIAIYIYIYNVLGHSK